MTDKPNRQDGDGLLPCPFCGSPAKALMYGPEVLIKIECTVCTAKISGFDQCKQDAIGAWNTRAPTRDGAEGADDGCPNCGSHAPNHNLGCFRAPPKPAPDAMREALDSLLEVAIFAKNNSESAPKDYKQTWAAHARKIREAIDAISIALSELVPPADGTFPRFLGSSSENDSPRVARCVFATDLSDEDHRKIATALIRPSPAVAAEPVSWRWRYKTGPEGGWLTAHKPITDTLGILDIEPLYASPPVRGDREASPDDIRAHGWTVAVHNDYRQGGKAYTFWLFTNGRENAKGEGKTDAEALNQVRAILSLPVQSGAGEREAILDDQLEQYLLVSFRRWGFDQTAIRALSRTVWKDGIDIERVDYSVMRMARDILALSRQAPHSSDEDDSVAKRQ